MPLLHLPRERGDYLTTKIRYLVLYQHTQLENMRCDGFKGGPNFVQWFRRYACANTVHEDLKQLAHTYVTAKNYGRYDVNRYRFRTAKLEKSRPLAATVNSGVMTSAYDVNDKLVNYYGYHPEPTQEGAAAWLFTGRRCLWQHRRRLRRRHHRRIQWGKAMLLVVLLPLGDLGFGDAIQSRRDRPKGCSSGLVENGNGRT
ncbi:hypothetical protein U9M48_014189 [Paspalum notatum var. saurae]|uniref:Uncharacterized protein n=1 Tax=Paspalum notatum var. saurae TaxID=547442 RepID=A0AAQ3WKA3_PASNO